MMVLFPKAGSLAFTPPGNEMNEVLSRYFHRQLWVRNLSKVAMQWLEVDSIARYRTYHYTTTYDIAIRN